MEIGQVGDPKVKCVKSSLPIRQQLFHRQSENDEERALK
jgi:hypothetical protein